MALPDIVARVRLDTSDLERGLQRATQTGSRAGSAIGSAFGSLAGGALNRAAGAVAGFAGGAVDAFAAVEDSIGAATGLFGSALPDVLKFADSATSSFGLSRAAAIDASNTFATLGKSAGLSGTDLSGFATKFAGLAGDLASFKGTSPEQAIEAIGAALRGEAEPIEKYGVLLNDATLRAEALKLGLISTTKDALTPQQKVLAAQSAILAQTTLQQGDYAKTADSTANTQKRLTNETANAAAELGEKMAPALTVVREGFLKGIVATTGLIDKLQGVSDKVTPLVSQLVTGLEPAAGKVRDVFVAVASKVPTPVLQVLGGVVGVVTAAIVVQTAATAAANAALVVYRTTTGLFTVTKTAEGVVEARGTVIRLAHNVATIASATASGIARTAVIAWTAAQAALNVVLSANPLGAVVLAVSAVVGGMVIAYKTSDTFRSFVDKLWAAIKTATSKLGDFLDKMKDFKLPGWVGDLADAFGGIAGGIGKAFGKLRDGVGDGPGADGGPHRGGSTLARVRPLLEQGMRISSTYRTPERNRQVGGSPNSYHIDRNNPAVDIVGSTAQLDRLYARLRAIGGWRELLWRVPNHAPGDNPHVHVAHNGGVVGGNWPTIAGLRADERPAILQTGEEVLSRAQRLATDEATALLRELLAATRENTAAVQAAPLAAVQRQALLSRTGAL